MQNLFELPQIDYVGLAHLVARDTTILTVNNRLARGVLQALARQQTARAQQVSEIPAVVPWSGWLAQQLGRAVFQDGLLERRLLLDNFAAQTLWVEVITEIEQDRVLLDVTQAATGAMQAAQLIDEWHITVDQTVQTQEYKNFVGWRDAYRSRLHALDALDPNSMVAALLQHIRAGLALPQNIVLAGFAEVSPRFGLLLDALVARGVQLLVLQKPAVSAGELRRVVAPNAQAEWHAAAHWARAQLASQPEGRYAIVAVSLDAQVPFARRVLSNVLSNAQGVSEYAFNIAVARPLADWQVGRAALAWLRTFVLFKEQNGGAPAEFSAALLAGYCAGHATELGARALIDARWRQSYMGHVNLASWTESLSKLAQLSPAWQRAWQNWQTLEATAPCDFWSQHFRATLALLGFPGQTQQSSAVYQAVEALDALFERFESLSAILGALTAGDALKLLSRLVRSTPFQPQRAANARLDVLGLLEAEGGQWDGVWLLGLTDEVLPAAAKPNPFIPIAALRQAQAPRSTPERERHWAEQIFANLCQTAPHIVLSSAQFEGERRLRASPLIASLVPSLESWAAAKLAFAPAELERQRDDQGPAVGEHEQIKGGIALLETQARNPLWAFLRYRLFARGLPAYTELADKMQRGLFLHGVLECLWRELGTQEALHEAIANRTLDAQLERIASEVGHKELRAFGETLRELEIARGIDVVRQWLALEGARLPFRVLEVEQKRVLSVKGLALEVRLDRLDAVAGVHNKVIIDYKTGATLPNVLRDWKTARPLNLQVPAYAMMLEQSAAPETLGVDQIANPSADPSADQVVGLVLVQLHAKEMAVAGLIQQQCLDLKGPKTLDEAKFEDENWQTMLTRLRTSIETLAIEFMTGHALNESWSKDDLKYCDVLPLLRLSEDEPDDE